MPAGHVLLRIFTVYGPGPNPLIVKGTVLRPICGPHEDNGGRFEDTDELKQLPVRPGSPIRLVSFDPNLSGRKDITHEKFEEHFDACHSGQGLPGYSCNGFVVQAAVDGDRKITAMDEVFQP